MVNRDVDAYSVQLDGIKNNNLFRRDHSKDKEFTRTSQ